LLQIGIYANVLLEDTGLWKPRTSPNLNVALADMKRFLGLEESREHDDYLMNLAVAEEVCKHGPH
jgi:hypothetical protein